MCAVAPLASRTNPYMLTLHAPYTHHDTVHTHEPEREGERERGREGEHRPERGHPHTHTHTQSERERPPETTETSHPAKG